MNKAELISAVHEELGNNATRRAASEAVDAVLKAIVKGVQRGKGRVQIVGFGTFKRVSRPERMGRNPKTLEPAKIPASKTVRFTPSEAVKESL
jgi:DNA-binding protein HU-beta